MDGAAQPDVPVLELQEARISYFTRAGEANVVSGVSFRLAQDEAIGLVGESGCGKSTIAYAVMRYLGGSGRLTGGRILFEGRDMAAMSERDLRQLRGSRLAMVYQDPMSSLNPVMTIGRQLMEVPIIHQRISAAEARKRALQMLEEVKLADPEKVFGRYPHQLSGGQQQRVVIAMALMAEPALLIMDEPTTGLDVTVEAAVLDLVGTLRKRRRTAIIFISHNLGTVVRVCDRIGVMYGGCLVEEGRTADVFRDPRHPYTRGLLECIPAIGSDKRSAPLVPIPGGVPRAADRPDGCIFAGRCKERDEARCLHGRMPAIEMRAHPTAPHRSQCIRARELPAWSRKAAPVSPAGPAADGEALLEADHLRKSYLQRPGVFGGARAYEVKAIDDISMFAGRGTTLAIVGESGCGKSTFAKVLAGLETSTGGRLRLAGEEVGAVPVDERSPALKRKMQMIFQDPYGSLNPSHSIGYALARALRRLKGVSGPRLDEEARRLMETVKLPPEHLSRMPRQLSGGQKQRVAIARALAGDPEVVIADEPVSALDVSVQAAILNLLLELQSQRRTTLVFISHDISVVRHMADFVAVMYLGKVVEFGGARQVFAPPYHPYTEALLSAVPVPDPDQRQTRIILEGTVPSPIDLPRGCPFSTRCPRKLGDICDTTVPPEQTTTGGHRIACHIAPAELRSVGEAG